MNDALTQDLLRIDGRPYGHYRDLRGRRYPLGSGVLTFEHVQGDPFAAPSRLRVDLPATLLRLPEWTRNGGDARRAAADFLQRALRPALAGAGGGAGSGRSGLLEIAPAGQEVLDRTGVAVGAEGGARVRLSAGLPAAGRRILGRAAADLLTRRLDAALQDVVRRLDFDRLRSHVEVVEDQVALRAQLGGARSWSRFWPTAACCRAAAAPTRVLSTAPGRCRRRGSIGGGVAGRRTPERCAASESAPGSQLIVGGGYHGKSTLLQALALGGLRSPARRRPRALRLRGGTGERARRGWPARCAACA